MTPEDFRRALEAAFRNGNGKKGGGRALPGFIGLEPVPGGSINQTFLLRTANADYFCKWNPDAPPGFFAREQEGLEALAAAGSGLLIPRVVGLSPGTRETPALLVMEYLAAETGATSRATWEKLGRGLAKLHRGTETRFGFPNGNYCGLTPQDNTWTQDWPGFYGRRRLGALVDKLGNRGDLSAGDVRILRSLMERLPGLLGHAPVPSLIHGDLWSGNFLAAVAGPALVDPAACFADREAEWGMMLLFGGFPDAVLDAYQESWPLPQGWRERVPLYQLYHVLNHFLLFGGSYGEQALRIARKFI